MSEEVDVLAALQEDSYRWGDIQAIQYDRKRTELFPEGYIGKLYHLCKTARRRSGNGILDTIFGGNPESTYDAIVSYLAPRPLVIMVKWEGEKFREIGFAFPTIFCGVESPEKAAFAGYGFFPWMWGKPELEIAAMLGMAFMFQEWGLKALHGIRFEGNLLTKKFTERFGFRQIGEIPHYQLNKEKKLVSGIVSTLEREVFETYVQNFLLAEYKNTQVPMIGTPEHPAVEEAPNTIDAQIAFLAAGSIPVVFLPFGSTYLPPVPEGMELHVVSEGKPGAGVYFFNPQQISAKQIEEAATNGTHGELLGHTQNKMEMQPDEPVVVVQALDSDGTILQDSVVKLDKEAVAIQMEVFRRRFPGCEIRVKDPLEVIDQRQASRQLPLNLK